MYLQTGGRRTVRDQVVLTTHGVKCRKGWLAGRSLLSRQEQLQLKLIGLQKLLQGALTCDVQGPLDIGVGAAIPLTCRRKLSNTNELLKSHVENAGN